MRDFPSNKSNDDATDQWYRQYYALQGALRNDLLKNPGVLFQRLACEISVIRSLRQLSLDVSSSRVLDVGCGNGQSLTTFLQLGFDPERLFGIDVQKERILDGQRKYPAIHFTAGDASDMKYPDDHFDLVLQSTMFVQITDEQLSRQIAREMIRVAKPQGHILLIDWRYPKPGSSQYRALSRSRIRNLFELGRKTTRVATYPGALVPPLGRFLSSYLASCYFLVQRCCPPLVGQQATVLRKLELAAAA